ncbi:hypothetical protein L9F63_022206 [Diploptera punctata]|uniref:Uncharacterized protein n=1 Tax=Diploptera punctata TaxID=6984 RepID=A0AAD7ZMH0_DIPPU|nr:hypothetical protein L9F63_022206 [Diploptera punctata]
MLVVFSAVANSEYFVAQDSSYSARKVFSSGYRSADSYKSQPEFSLEGKPIFLQHRLSPVPPVHDKSQRYSLNKNTYKCLIEQTAEKKTRDCKVSAKRISGGVRRASVRRREEQQKPSIEIVYQQKTKRKVRKVAISRQPLAMSVMSFPGKHLPRYCSCEEANQVLPSTEEAKATLKRLLASRNHESMMSESVGGEANRHEAAGLLDKPAYLEDTYDYLFNRHVQTLNGVIKRQEQEKLEQANEINQQKNRKQVIQLCCGGDNSACEDDASVIIGSEKSSTRQNSSRVAESRSCRSAENCNNNHSVHNTACSCAVSGGKCQLNHEFEEQCNSKSVNNNISKTVNVNLVTSQIQELELLELEPQKPLIIFNHVPTSNENSPLPMDSEEDSRPVVSPPRSRSPTPLLEVPFPVKDIDCEMKRPPIN